MTRSSSIVVKLQTLKARYSHQVFLLILGLILSCGPTAKNNQAPTGPNPQAVYPIPQSPNVTQPEIKMPLNEIQVEKKREVERFYDLGIDYGGKLLMAYDKNGHSLPLIIADTKYIPTHQESSDSQNQQSPDSVSFLTTKGLLGTLEGQLLAATQMGPNHILAAIVKPLNCKHLETGFDQGKQCHIGSIKQKNMYLFLYQLSINPIENQSPKQVGMMMLDKTLCIPNQLMMASTENSQLPPKVVLSCSYSVKKGFNHMMLKIWQWDQTANLLQPDQTFGNRGQVLLKNLPLVTTPLALSAESNVLTLAAGHSLLTFDLSSVRGGKTHPQKRNITAKGQKEIRIVALGHKNPETLIGFAKKIAKSVAHSFLSKTPSSLSVVKQKNLTLLLTTDDKQEPRFYDKAVVRQLGSQLWIGLALSYGPRVTKTWRRNLKLEAFCWDLKTSSFCSGLIHGKIDTEIGTSFTFLDDFQVTENQGQKDLWYLGTDIGFGDKEDHIDLIRYSILHLHPSQANEEPH